MPGCIREATKIGDMFQHLERTHDITTTLKERYLIVDKKEATISIFAPKDIPARFRSQLEKESAAQLESREAEPLPEVEVPA